MSTSWILFIWMLGIGFLGVELFMPGIIVGVLGLVCLLGSIGLMFGSEGAVAGAGLTLVSTIFAGGVAVVVYKRWVLTDTLDNATGYVGTDDHSDLIGLTGVTLTMLRPGGFATIGGKRIDVVTQGELVEKDVPVEVVRVEGNRVEVRATA